MLAYKTFEAMPSGILDISSPNFLGGTNVQNLALLLGEVLIIILLLRPGVIVDE